MNVIDTLTLALGIDAKGIDVGLQEAQRKIDAGAKSLANSLLSPLKAALGGIVATFSLAAMTRQYLQQADSIGKMADAIGADMEEMQAWGEAAKRAGGSAEAFNGTVQGLTRSLQQAAQGAKGPAAQALQQLGVRATDTTGKARDAFEVLRDLAGKMEGMDKQKAMGLGQRLGIDRGTIMLLQSGRAAVDDLITRQKELGVYTKEDAEIAAKCNDAIADLSQTLKAAAAIVMRAIVPAITWVTKHLTALVKDFREHKTFYLTALGAIATVLSAKIIPSILKTLGIAKFISAPFLALYTIIVGLALLFEDLWVYANGGKSALPGIWKQLGTGEEVLEKFNKAWEKVKKTGDTVCNSLTKAVDEMFTFFAKEIDNFLLIFDGLFEVIDGLFNFDFEEVGHGLARAFTGAWNIISDIFESIFGDMDKMSVWDAVENGAKKAWDAIKKFAKGFFDGLPPEAQKNIKEIWDTITKIFNWEELKKKFNWEDISKAAQIAWDWIWQYITQGADTAWELAKKSAIAMFNALPPEAQKKLKEIWEAFKSFIHWDEIKDKFNWEEIKQNAQIAWDEIKTICTDVLEYLSGKLVFVSDIVDGIWTAIKGLFDFDFNKLGEGLGKAFNSAYNLIKDIFKDIFGLFDNIPLSAESAWDTAVEIAKTAWEKISGFATSFFNELDPELQHATKIVTAFIAAWAINKTIQGIISLGKEISTMGKIIEGAFSFAKKNPLFLILAVLALIILYWDDIEKAIKDFFAWLDKKLQWLWKLVEKISNAIKSVKEFLVGVSEGEKQRGESDTNAMTGIGDMHQYMPGAQKTTPPPTPKPQDNVSSGAVAHTTSNDSHDVTVTDNSNPTYNFYGPTDEAEAAATRIEKSRKQNLVQQAGSGVAFAGGSYL